MIKVEIKSKETKQTLASKEFNSESEIGPWLKQYVHLQTVYIILTKESGVTTLLERHRIMVLVPTTLREVAVNNYLLILLIVSAVYVAHALWGLV